MKKSRIISEFEATVPVNQWNLPNNISYSQPESMPGPKKNIIDGKDLTNEEFLTVLRETTRLTLTTEEIERLPEKVKRKVKAIAVIEKL